VQWIPGQVEITTRFDFLAYGARPIGLTQATSGKLRAPACGHTSPTRNRLELQASSFKQQAA